MPLNLNGYPLDKTAAAASNRINPEVVQITTPASRLFVPSAGFFFGKNFRIFDQNGVALLPSVDYKLVNLEKDATIETGRDVYSVVNVIKASVTQVSLDYQCVGGIYSDSANSIRQLILSLPNNAPLAVYWGQILNRPVQFPPAAHMHHAADWYGLGEVVTLLDEIRQAILVGDTAQLQAVYAYITETLETGLSEFLRDNVATIQEVYNGLDDIKFCTPAKLRYAVRSTFASSVTERNAIDLDTTDEFFVQKSIVFQSGQPAETVLVHTYTLPSDDFVEYTSSTQRAQVAFSAAGVNIWSRRFNGTNWTAWIPLVKNNAAVNHDAANSYLLGTGQVETPLAVDIAKVYLNMPGITHNQPTSYLLGTGKPDFPLSVNVNKIYQDMPGITQNAPSSYLLGNGKPDSPLAVDINRVYDNAPGITQFPAVSYLLGNGKPNTPLVVDVNRIYQDAPGVSHDALTSYLTGDGKSNSPLAVDANRLNSQFVQLRNLPISQVGDPNDSFLPASSGYFSITAPRGARRNSGAMYLEANGDILGLTPTTNGEVIRMVYFRIKGFSDGRSESVATDRVYKPAFLTGTESVQSCFPTSENAMVVEIWDVDGYVGDGGAEGREVFKEHAIVLLNETLVDSFHTHAYRLGSLLINQYADTTLSPYSPLPHTHSIDPTDVANGQPIAIINAGVMNLFLAKNDLEVVCWTAGLSTPFTGVNNSNGSTFFKHTNWQTVERRINPATNSVSLSNSGPQQPNIQPYITLGEFGGNAKSLFRIDDAAISFVPWKGGTDQRTGSLLNVAKDKNGYLTLCITHHLRPQWENGSAIFTRSITALTTLQIDVGTRIVYHNRYISGGVYPRNLVILNQMRNDLFSFVQPEHQPIAPSIGDISIRGWNQLLTDGTIAYGSVQSSATGTQSMTVLRRTPLPMKFDRAYASMFHIFYPYVTTETISVKLYLDPPTPYHPRSIARFINNNWLLAIPGINTQFPLEPNALKNVYRPAGNLFSRSYQTPEYGTLAGYNIANERYAIGGVPAPATLGSWNGGQATHNNLSFWKDDSIVFGVDNPSKDQVRHRAFNVLPDASGQIRIFEDAPVYLGNQVNAWISESLKPNHDGGGDDLEWNLYIPPFDETKGVLIVATLNNGFASTSYYAVKIEYSGPIIVGLNGAIFGIHQSIPFTRTFGGFVLAPNSGVAIQNGSLCQHIGTVITWVVGQTVWWAIRSGFVANLTSRTQVDTAYRIYEQIEDPDLPEDFDLVLNGTVNVGVGTVYATVQNDLGPGLMDSGAGFGALTVFRKLSPTGYDGAEFVIATPRPAEGFYVNVTGQIPVLLSGVIRYIDPGQYSLTEQISNPANKTIYVYATLSQGSAFLEFLETPAIETNFRTYLGQLTTDLTGITGGTLSPVSRFQTFRASTTERGSSFAVSGGRPDQTTGINLGWT